MQPEKPDAEHEEELDMDDFSEDGDDESEQQSPKRRTRKPKKKDSILDDPQLKPHVKDLGVSVH